MITEELLNIMACPICKGHSLRIEIQKQKKSMVIEGVISCTFCRRRYLIEDGIPCMLPDDLRDTDAILGRKKTSRVSSESKLNLDKWGKKQDEYLNWLKSKWEIMDSLNEIKLKTKELHQTFFDCYKPKGSVLDIGCERGKIRQYLNENYYVGIDPANFIRENLVKEIDFPFIQCVGEYLPFKKRVFDNILILSVLDHTATPSLVLNESFRILKNSGHIFILSPLEANNLVKKSIIKLLKGNLQGLIKGLSDRISGDVHLHHFSAKELTSLVHQHFERLEIREVSNGEILFIKGQKWDGKQMNERDDIV